MPPLSQETKSGAPPPTDLPPPPPAIKLSSAPLNGPANSFPQAPPEEKVDGGIKSFTKNFKATSSGNHNKIRSRIQIPKPNAAEKASVNEEVRATRKKYDLEAQLEDLEKLLPSPPGEVDLDSIQNELENLINSRPNTNN